MISIPLSHLQVLWLLAFVVLFSSCRTLDNRPDASAIKTDLRNNEEIAATFARYQAVNQHCQPRGDAKRALVTGFGLFGDPYNISGIVAMNLVRAGFTPASFDPQTDESPSSEDALWQHGDTTITNGGAVLQRTMRIQGEAVEVCALLLDVQWDLAAAIILDEAARFRPHVIIMAGANGRENFLATFEQGAVNKAKAYAGFDSSGTQIPENIPVSAYEPIVPSLPFSESRVLSWDAEGLASATAELAQAIDPVYGTQVGRIREENSYICNNVSFAVAIGTSNTPLDLAGGHVSLPSIDLDAKIGFLHYPWRATEAGFADDARQVFGWVRVLAASLAYSLAEPL